MALTKAEATNKVLRILGKLPEGQPAQAWVSEVVGKCLDQAQAYLEADGLAYWETSAIPDGVAQGFCNYVAGRAAPEIMSTDEARLYVGLADVGLAEMRRFCAVGDATVKAVFY
jgi:hypothetical protein